MPQVLEMSVLSTPLTVLYKVKLQWHCVIVRAFIGFVDFSCCADFRYVFDYDQLLMFTNGEGIWAKLEVTGKWRRLHNEELYDLDSVPNVIRVIKPRRMRWAVHLHGWRRQGMRVGFWWGNLKE